MFDFPSQVLAYALQQLNKDTDFPVAMVGDATSDADGAKANHVTSVSVAWGYGDQHALQRKSPYFAETMKELERILVSD